MRAISFVLVILLSVTSLSCSNNFRPVNNRYPVSSLLNGETWYGNGKAVKLRMINNDPCSNKRFMLFIQTDLPITGSRYIGKRDTVTGCMEACNPTQGVSFYNVPLKKGTYKILDLDQYGTLNKDGSHYNLLIKSGGVAKSYVPQNRKSNWIRVNKYDSINHTIKGSFRLRLKANYNSVSPDSTDKLVRFDKGTFNVKLEESRPPSQ